MAGTTAETTVLKSAETWLQKHERLIALLLVLAASVWIGNKLIDRSADRDKLAASVAEQQLNDQKAVNEQQAQLNAQTAAQYQQMVQTLTAQNTALAQAVSARNTALAQQQQKDKTMPPNDLILRWSQLIQTEGVSQQRGSDAFTVSDEAARATVEELEQVPVLEANVKDTQAVADNRQQELGKANGVISGLNTQVTGLNAQIQAQDKACKDKLDSQNADARKSKRNWFLRGAVAGAAIVAHFTLHI